MLFISAVQHERKPIIDRKQDNHKNSTSEINHETSTQAKSRKKVLANESMNYLSLFQLNPSILMQAAANVNSAQSFQQNSSPTKADLLGVKIEENFGDEEFYENKASSQESSELFESVQEQKLLNSAFELISLIESSLQNSHDTKNNETIDEKMTISYLSKLTDENASEFKIQLPQILLPKMHYVCEIGSRILFKTIDWLKDNNVWKYFGDEDQSAILQNSWAELLVIGLAQVLASSPESLQLKSIIISTLVNYVKSLIIYSANESHQLGVKGDFKSTSGHKIKKMLSNIALINKFIDEITQLREFLFYSAENFNEVFFLFRT
jgi:hypothetical protein